MDCFRVYNFAERAFVTSISKEVNSSVVESKAVVMFFEQKFAHFILEKTTVPKSQYLSQMRRIRYLSIRQYAKGSHGT